MKRDKRITWHRSDAFAQAFTGKHIAVIGGTGGIGRALSLHLASLGANVVVVGQTFRDAGTPRIEFIQAELEAGAWKVICEGRESGTVGIFHTDGEVKSGVVDEIVTRIDPTRLIFEAPQKAQQVWFIRKFGPNVNLGNIPHDEVIPLETLRLGLRADTLLDSNALGNVDGAGI